MTSATGRRVERIFSTFTALPWRLLVFFDVAPRVVRVFLADPVDEKAREDDVDDLKDKHTSSSVKNTIQCPMGTTMDHLQC